MLKKQYTQEELQTIMKLIPDRKGWNFSYMKTASQQVPWNYTDIIKLYMTSEDVVLDVGTGGGERFKSLGKHFKSGLGLDIDPEMIAIANENKPENMTFLIDNERLQKVNNTFSMILNRHAPYDLSAIAKSLQKNGYFITQQVGEKNMRTIIEVVGKPSDEPTISASMFHGTGLRVVAFLEYNVDYTVLNIESLLFWLNALDMLHAGFDGGIATTDVNLLNKMLNKGYTTGGFLTNEHRYLVIAQKI